jgi:hypothetical protein
VRLRKQFCRSANLSVSAVVCAVWVVLNQFRSQKASEKGDALSHTSQINMNKNGVFAYRVSINTMLSGKLIFSNMADDHSEKYCMHENVDEMLNFYFRI